MIMYLTPTQAFGILGVKLTPKGIGSTKGYVCESGRAKGRRYKLKRNSDGHIVYRWGRIGSAEYNTATKTMIFRPI